MRILDFLKQWSLPCSALAGALIYLIFAYVPVLAPVGEVCEPVLTGMLPMVLFALLFVTFCKIQLHDLRPRKWHFWLQFIRICLSGAVVWLISLTSDASVKLILEGVFICVICPTAAAAPVITEKLGGSIASSPMW